MSPPIAPAGPVVEEPPQPSAPPFRPCEGHTQFDPRQDGERLRKVGLFGGQAEARRVLLSGGEPASLLSRYFREAEEAERRLDFARIEVVLFGANGERAILAGGQDVRMSVGQLLAGTTWEDVWARALRSRMAAARSDAEMQADALIADLICGPP